MTGYIYCFEFAGHFELCPVFTNNPSHFLTQWGSAWCKGWQFCFPSDSLPSMLKCRFESQLVLAEANSKPHKMVIYTASSDTRKRSGLVFIVEGLYMKTVVPTESGSPVWPLRLKQSHTQHSGGPPKVTHTLRMLSFPQTQQSCCKR